jgi:methylmalonyl-CoA/ethylmalonyl-CoA epimerase
MDDKRFISQICIVVDDVRRVNANWARVLQVPEAEIVSIFPEGINHYTHGQAVDYKNILVAKYDLGNFILELLQPASSPSPWRAFLDQNGPGVFHFCLQVVDRREMQQNLNQIGVGLPYHVGYHPGGSYSYIHSRDQLGLELSINDSAAYSDLIANLLSGKVDPLDEIN